jgi:hypothetical protein
MSSYAMIEGGTAYAAGTQADMVTQTTPTAASPATWAEIDIYSTGTAGVTVSFTDSHSYGTGGGIYLKNGILTITDLAISSA